MRRCAPGFLARLGMTKIKRSIFHLAWNDKKNDNAAFIVIATVLAPEAIQIVSPYYTVSSRLLRFARNDGLKIVGYSIKQLL